MAKTVEIAIIEGLEGKTRSEQLARLNEWKKEILRNGADSVTIYEAGAGTLNANWVMTVSHASAEAFGKVLDSYYQNPKSYDEVVEVWMKSPVLKYNSYSIMHEIA